MEVQQRETVETLELTQAEASRLREQNAMLSVSLSSQTQRLELAMQQSMAAAVAARAPGIAGAAAASSASLASLDPDEEGQAMVDGMISWMLSFLGGRRGNT
jgi:hypothetical protein